MAECPLSLPLVELLMLRITQGQKLGLCSDKELERIIDEQCLYFCSRGKAVAIRPSRSRSFTSERPLIVMVTSRDLAVRHKSHNKGPFNKLHCERKVIAQDVF